MFKKLKNFTVRILCSSYRAEYLILYKKGVINKQEYIVANRWIDMKEYKSRKKRYGH